MIDAFNFADFDRSVRPQDDLFRFVNGTWLRESTIDDDRPSAGAFVTLRKDAEAAVRDIISGLGDQRSGPDGEAATGPERGADAVKIADLYASFMDEEAIERRGTEPLRGPLAAIDAVASVGDLLRLLGALFADGNRSLFGLSDDADPGDPANCVMFVAQSGLGLPDEEYYREDKFSDIREHYLAHVERTLALAGMADAGDQARAVLDLETEIAACHWDKVRTRDLRQMYNPMPWAEFVAADGIAWEHFLTGAGIPGDAFTTIVNCQPSFFTEVAALLTEDRLPVWRSWARFATVSSLSRYLAAPFVDERFHFYGTVLNGTPANSERWKRAVALVEGALGEAVGKIYVERHFSPVAKQRMDDLVADLIEAYRRSITDLDWMTEPTREQALAKLAKFTPKIGFPTTWRDYSSLRIRRDDLVANVTAASRFELRRSLDKVSKPVDREEWFMTPQTVNAYYHPLRNEIVFPAAILQPPFFNEYADDPVNYGGIGSVIGHEIGHGFDDQGSTCDGDGRLRDWWTPDDRSAFEQRTGSLVEQYNQLSPAGADGRTVNGELTIGENIGDLGGLSIAFKAWQIAQERRGERDTDRDGFTPEQRLFLSWAAVWQSKYRPEATKQMLATDPHSPAEFRCNQIVRNVEAYYDAFGLGPEDRLWLEPDARVSIW